MFDLFALGVSDYDVLWEDETDTVTCVHSLQTDANPELLQVTSLSWNCTGGTIAAAYPLFKLHRQTHVKKKQPYFRLFSILCHAINF